MRKSRLQSWHWTRLLSARVVQHAALLFNELPRCRRDRPPETETTRSVRRDLLRLAFLATGRESAAAACPRRPWVGNRRKSNVPHQRTAGGKTKPSRRRTLQYATRRMI